MTALQLANHGQPGNQLLKSGVITLTQLPRASLIHKTPTQASPAPHHTRRTAPVRHPDFSEAGAQSGRSVRGVTSALCRQFERIRFNAAAR
jgi:hypothetical protein